VSRSLLIGGLALGGGALIALALREREAIGGAATLVVKEAKREAKKAVRKAAQTATGITQPKLDNINKYNIAALVNAIAPEISFGLKMAMIEHESANTFDPVIYNYYVKDYSVNPKGEPVKGKNGRKILKATRALPGAPLVEKWLPENRSDPMKNGGFQFDPHAVGLFQILDDIRINPRPGKPFNYGGVPLPYLNDLIDPEKNIRAALAGAQSNVKEIKGNGVTDESLIDKLIYFAHADGIGRLTKGKYPGAFMKLKELGKAINWENIKALPWGSAGWWAFGNPGIISGVEKVSRRAEAWEYAKKNLLDQSRPLAVAAGEYPTENPE